jgi:hypothetical protein
MGRPLDCDVHGLTKVVILELLDAIGRLNSPLRVRLLVSHDFDREKDAAVAGRGFCGANVGGGTRWGCSKVNETSWSTTKLSQQSRSFLESEDKATSLGGVSFTLRKPCICDASSARVC